MLLASYIGTRTGLKGLISVIKRWYYKSRYTHSEIVFEPGDGVEDLMPDKSLDLTIDFEFWCASMVFGEIMPMSSPLRAGQNGGIRLKRIDVNDGNWDLIPIDPKLNRQVAAWFFSKLGQERDLYNKKYTSSSAIAKALGIIDYQRFNPPALKSLVFFLRNYSPFERTNPVYLENDEERVNVDEDVQSKTPVDNQLGVNDSSVVTTTQPPEDSNGAT